MTKDQLLSKWSVYGTLAALKDTCMTPCYSEDVMSGTGIEDLLLHGREQWETTDHFWIKYGQLMYQDALSVTDLYPSLSSIRDFRDAFWEAREDEVDAHSLIEQVAEIRTANLAKRMLAILEVVGEDVCFTEEAIRQRTPEFQSLAEWVSKTYGPASFLLGQAYNMLDHVIAEGLEDIKHNYPEPDCYTYNLIYWLSLSTSNLQYVTEALAEGSSTDGFNLLQRAQSLAIQDAWMSLAQILRDLLK